MEPHKKVRSLFWLVGFILDSSLLLDLAPHPWIEVHAVLKGLASPWSQERSMSGGASMKLGASASHQETGRGSISKSFHSNSAMSINEKNSSLQLLKAIL